MRKEEKQHRIFDERKREYLFLFSREAKQVRDSIVNDLPAYNTLLSIHAETFEEAALRTIASDRGITYDKNDPPKPDCPKCKNHEAVGSKGKGLYRCRACGGTFSANNNSISSGTKCDALTWMKVLYCLLDHAGISKTCEYCSIAENTYYSIRSRIFYAMQIMMDRVKLYGTVEVDHTFVRASYKGVDLQANDYPEDSIFFNAGFKPRSARRRGHTNSPEEQNTNTVCIFTAIDDRGHVLTRFVGVGSATFRALENRLSRNKFLLTVPEEDPFEKWAKKRSVPPKTNSGDKSVMVADKEKTIEKYAQSLDLGVVSHVFRRNGQQQKLPTGSCDIQRVNALHRRLKDFLRRSNYVSTKYLPGYLVLFEFIENTGASQAAIEGLFQIIARPGLGKPASFYQEMYTVPNYLIDWLSTANPLKRLSQNKLLAFYLYDQMCRPDEYPGFFVSMSQIEQETGYSAPTVRKTYRDLCAAGYRDLIVSHFSGTPSKRESKPAAKATTTFNPVVLEIYDEYAKNRTLPTGERLGLEKLLEEKNRQYGTNYTRTNIHEKFRLIQKSGIRPPLPAIETKTAKGETRYMSERALAILEDYKSLIRSYRERGEPVPRSDILLEKLSEKYGLSINTIRCYVYMTAGYQKRSQKTDEKY